MNKIIFRGNRFVHVPQLLDRRVIEIRRKFSKDKDEKELSSEELYKMRKGGILHDKQQSPQEESYFHKEEAEQLRQLKKKMDKEKDQKEETEKKD